jgi:peptidoglycan/xylan/chitin deacetylase (PgdA/CDA1 family)
VAAVSLAMVVLAGTLGNRGRSVVLGLVPVPVTSFGTISPKPSKPPKPKPSTTSTPKPKPKPTATPPASSISGASLGIPGAGTWKIPAWGSTLHYRGPDGSMGSTGSTSVALTFDDGPGPYTSQVLDLLDAYHVKATFCLIGRQINDYRSVVKRMIADGMTICNHSWDHNEQLGRQTPQEIAANMQRMINAVHQIDPDAAVTYYRQPGGNFTPTISRVAELLGMRPLYWTEDTNDWRRPGTEAIEKSLTSSTHRGSIVLLHDAGGDRTETIAALKALLPQLKQRYRLTALSTSRTVSVAPPTPLPSSPPTPSAPPSPAPSPVYNDPSAPAASTQPDLAGA